MLITDNQTMLRCAKKSYDLFKVPTCNISGTKKKRKYTNADKASLDIFCDSDAIGVIVNLSQEINTLVWDTIAKEKDWDKALEMYRDSALLSVLSSIAIDQTKREFSIDCMEEFRLIKAKYDRKDEDGRAIKPKFFGHVAKDKGYYDKEHKNYMEHDAPMDYVQSVVSKAAAKRSKANIYLSLGDILADMEDENEIDWNIVRFVVSLIRNVSVKRKELFSTDNFNISCSDKCAMADNLFRNCVDTIESLDINKSTIIQLILESEKEENRDIKNIMWNVVFGSENTNANSSFIDLLRSSKETIYTIEATEHSEEADVFIFGLPFVKVPS